jgi:hypothetical protein
MMTVRHIERLWNARVWGRLLRELLPVRPEYSPRLEEELHSPPACAAMSMIRLDELNQTHTPLFSKLTRTVLASQDTDGGWRDPLTTAVCLRALMIDGGCGIATDRGLQYLANMQQDAGIWPRVPIRRRPSDAFVSALILFHLADHERFRAAVRFDDAVEWFRLHAGELDRETARLWQHAAATSRRTRCGREPALLWS